MSKCYFCEFPETIYCKICKKWFCDEYRQNYTKKMKILEGLLSKKNKVVQ